MKIEENGFSVYVNEETKTPDFMTMLKTNNFKKEEFTTYYGINNKKLQEEKTISTYRRLIEKFLEYWYIDYKEVSRVFYEKIKINEHEVLSVFAGLENLEEYTMFYVCARKAIQEETNRINLLRLDANYREEDFQKFEFLIRIRKEEE